MCLPVIFSNLPAEEIAAMMRWYSREAVEDKRMIPVMPFDEVMEIAFKLLE